MSLDLSQLEAHSADFRTEELYFIRICGPYIEGIFREVYSRGSGSKGRLKRRQVLTDILTCTDFTSLKGKDKSRLDFSNEGSRFLREALVPNLIQGNRPHLDTISGQFRRLLEALPEAHHAYFEETLRLHYAISNRLALSHSVNQPSFIEIVGTLAKRRNFLEHYGEPPEKEGKKSDTDKYNDKRIKGENGYRDSDILYAMGLFLLPELMHRFAGRVAHYEAKLGLKREQAERVRNHSREAVKIRRENTKNLFASERTRANIKDKAKRKKLVDPSVPWRQAYLRLQKHPTDYKEHEFKLRYHFIGRGNIEAIRTQLGGDRKDGGFHFKRDIEAFYTLSLDINLVMHRQLNAFAKDNEDKILGRDEAETALLRALRNTIAHNGLFWRVKRPDKTADLADDYLSVDNVFSLILSGLMALDKGPDRVNDFYTQVERLLRRENYCVFDIRGELPQSLKIKKWSPDKRQAYAKPSQEGQSLDQRRDYRRSVAGWMRSLKRALEGVKREAKDKQVLLRNKKNEIM
jgi:hypothetical protein